MNRFIPSKINELKEYTPDNGTYTIRADANESPYLPSPELMAELEDSLRSLAFNRYPDSTASGLVNAFTDYYGLPRGCAVAGNGSDELISIIESSFLSAGDVLVVADPDFSMYEFYAGISGVETAAYEKGDGFGIDLDSLLCLCREKKAKMVMMSNPCNPTGVALDAADVMSFVRRADCLVVIDEAYMDFCTASSSVLSEAPATENLIVLKTLSKAFGMASLRCGFAVSNRDIIGAVGKVKSPYNVNSFTQAAGTAVLRRKAEAESKRKEIIEERKRLYTELKKITEGFPVRVFPSETNFVLLKPGGKSREIFDLLLERSIKIRYMGDYLRITAAGRRDDDEILSSLAAIFSQVYDT